MDRKEGSDSAALTLAVELMSRHSITPDDAGCHELIASRLERLGFQSEEMNVGSVRNLWTIHGTESPLFVFAGHTDVVPPGDMAAWVSDPFGPEVRGDMLYGRGASDMKAAVAAFVVAAEEFVMRYPEHPGSIALLLTSDEEGPAIDGTRHVVEMLKSRNKTVDFCIVGEPSSGVLLGDAIRVGRRGSLTGFLKFHGVQGHVAYPDKVENPIHRAMPAMVSLLETEWDVGEACVAGNPAYFPQTSLQICRFRSDAGADNVVPQMADIVFNFRFSPRVTVEGLKKKVEEKITQALIGYNLSSYEISWQVGAVPYMKEPGKLASSVSDSVEALLGIRPSYSTAGGTSDGRFISEIATELIELGMVNETIHKVNECVRAADVERLKLVYLDVLERVLIS